MINTIIADDEPIIRNGMKDIVDWHSLGFRLTGTAKDGMDALKYIEQEEIHVVITDIRMPFLDGLELIKIVKKLHPDIYCILLTSYAEFEYAKQAINLGAYSYIIKPIDVDEFQKTLSNIKEDFEKCSRRKQYISKLELYIRQLEDFQNQNLFSHQKSDADLMDLGEAYILKHYCEKEFSLTAVSQHVGFDTSYFSRLFKQKYKIGFQDYIISLRIEKAKRLLGMGTYTVSAVCEMVGYENYSHFSSLFKKKVGISPGRYVETL